MKMADVIYTVQCKDCSGSYIGEPTRPLEVRLKEHCAEADKVTKARVFFSQAEKKLSGRKYFKSTIAEHTAMENHTFEWDNAKKIEQVPGWRMRE